MKKKVLCLLVMAAAMMLTACGHQHEWIEATCTEPKTCATCGETEGEALGHTWAEATCTEPKTCTVCGATEGEALGHVLENEANYQSAAICSVCGEAVGEPLVADFDKLGYTCDMEVGVTYDYTAACSEDRSIKTVGKVTITDYSIFTSDDTHEEKEGYEWRVISYESVFSDQNASNYGVGFGNGHDDYYSLEEESQDSGEDEWKYTINYKGEDFEVHAYQDFSYSWAGDTLTVHCTDEFQVPIGYDGVILYMYDGEARSDSGYNSFLNLYDPDGPNANLIFRLD